MEPIKLFELNFDASERLSSIAWALDAAAVPPEAPVLDVGGHPSLLARSLPNRNILTIDFPGSGNPPYVKGSGTALPFRDASFDAVVSSDTLEHVPPAERSKFLTEISRVSRGYVFLGGPFSTSGVAHAESRIRELLGYDAPGNRWLAEHSENGLPDLRETVKQLAAGAQDAAAIPSGDLLSWYLLFAAQSVLPDLPGGPEALMQFMSAYNQHWPKRGETPTTSYRHLIAVSQRIPLPSSFVSAKMTGHSIQSEPLLQAQSANPGDCVVIQIDTLHTLISALRDSLRKLSSAGQTGSALDAAYIDQLEKALAHQNAQISKLEPGASPVHGPRR